MNSVIKRLLAILLLSFPAPGIFAQDGNPVILTNEKPVGQNYLINKEIRAKEIVFPERIYDSYMDTITNMVTIQLRGTSKNGKWMDNTGDLMLYDLGKMKLAWTKGISYQQSSVQQFDNVIIQTIANKSYCLNIENGETQWQVKNAIYYVEPFRHVGLGYKFKNSTGLTNTLEGTDLATGNTIWEREINHEYGWNSISHLNDSVLLVTAAGLHTINLRTGKGWDYDAKTGDKDYTSTVAANAAGVALGLLTGTFMMTTGHDVIRDLVSNTLVDSSEIYIASKEKITCLNHDGLILWSNPVTKDLAGKSSISVRDSLLYMVSYGCAYMGNRQLSYGIPAVTIYNKNSGKQVSSILADKENGPILTYKIKNDTIILMFKDRLAKYSLKSNSLIAKKTFAVETTGELRQFPGGQVYLKTDSVFNSIFASPSANLYIYTKSGKMLELNAHLDIIKQLDYDQLYINYLKTGNYKFLANKDSTIIINPENRKIAELQVSRNSVLIGSRLYDIQERCFLEVDMDEFMKN